MEWGYGGKSQFEMRDMLQFLKAKKCLEDTFVKSLPTSLCQREE
jgi:hypothetical protein